MALDTEHFIQIPGTEATISPTQEYNGLNYSMTHFKLVANGLFMPTSSKFFTHRNNVIMAKNGKSELLYATGEKVPKPKVKEIYHILLNDCWIWLNGRFVRGSGFNGLDLGTVVDVKYRESHGELITKKEPLKRCINKHGYVSLNFNNQGFPTKRSSEPELIRERNFEYHPPLEDAVARFGADSVMAYLYCSGDPQYSDGALGVFPCAKNTKR